MGLFHARIYIGALGRRPHLGGGVSSPGGTHPHLGATRPRVGICLSRLDALTSKYNTFSYCQVGASNPNLAIPTRGRVAPRWGFIIPPSEGASPPQVRMRPQRTYIYTRKTSPFMFFNTKHKKIVLIICSFKAESVLLPCYSFPAKKSLKKVSFFKSLVYNVLRI